MLRPQEQEYRDRLAYARAKARAKARSAAITLAGQDIGSIPPPKDLARRHRADRDFKFFCESYFAHLFSLAWSQDHLRVIAKIERVVRDYETLAVAMPRGSGKTTLCLTAVIWAILSGQHKFVYLIASTQEAAVAMLANIKSHLAGNDGLLEDYPEAIKPIRCLEGETRRCNGQRYYGVPTRMEWGMDELVMPTIPGSRSAGSIIRVSGLTGNIRGALHVRPDGSQVRPSLAICDDPQTDQSAKSILQTSERLDIIRGAIKYLAGPGERTAIIIPCTVIQSGDLADKLLNRQDNPEWHGERTRLIYQFPTNTRLWAEYAKIRQESLRADGDGHEATEFYAAHRAEMDAGAAVAWPERYSSDELSALQHAMNLRLANEVAFFSEYQNEPLLRGVDEGQLVAADIAQKVNGHKRGAVPTASDHLTMFVDVHDKLLYWMVTAWSRDFTGWIIDYGTFPDQPRGHFGLREARFTLGLLYPQAGKEGAIQGGLTALLGDFLKREWTKDDKTVVQVARCLVDSGYFPDLVFNSVRASGRLTQLMPSKGVGIGPDGKPFSEYIRKVGEQYGLHWRIPSVRGTRELATLNIDTNFWKTFVRDRLATAPGDPGSLTLFGVKGTDHTLLSEHLTSEYRTPTIGRKRSVDVWKLKPNMVDNHWWDCLVGCAAAASVLGCCLPGLESVAAGRRSSAPMKLSSLQRRS